MTAACVEQGSVSRLRASRVLDLICDMSFGGEEWVKLGKGKIKTIRPIQAALGIDTKLYFKV
jgi:hypothetical protein